MQAIFNLDYSEPILFLSIHSGNHLSPNIREKISISDNDRMREEDPYTDLFINDKKNHIIQLTSRFEYDLNRHRDNSVYKSPEDCWGLKIYQNENLTDLEINNALQKHDDFYEKLTSVIDNFLSKYERIFVWDIHSYNHHRNGLNQPFDSDEENPEIILGTNRYAFMPDKWKPLINQIELFLKNKEISEIYPNRSLKSTNLDVRQNIKYPGGYLSQYLNSKYSTRLCCVAIEFKKIWMNEWTQQIDNNCFNFLKGIFDNCQDCILTELQKRR